MSHRIQLGVWAGTHSAELHDSGNLIVEWYAFGDNEPYESANILTFDKPSQGLFARALGPLPSSGPDAFLNALAERFSSYFAVREFADLEGIPYTHEVDFEP